MIKLDRVILKVKDDVNKKIENMSEIYQEEVKNAEILDGDIPKPPTYTLKREDYDETVVKYGVRPSDIIDVTEDEDRDTIIIVAGRGTEIIVKQSLEEIIKIVEDDERKVQADKDK